jgi:AAA ATPase-like protein
MLHGRDAELAEIDKLLNGMREGFGGALVIQGDAGIGKSALLDLAALRAGDMTVIRGVGVESETEFAFAGLHLLLSPYVHLVDRLPEPQAAALRGALGLGHTPDQDRFLVGLGVLTLLSDIAEKTPYSV